MTRCRFPAPGPSPSRGCAKRCWRIFGWRQAFAWGSEPDPPLTAGRTGIVFIHGFMCNRGFWVPWLRRARALGIPFRTVTLEPVFTAIDAYAPQVERAVAEVERATGRPPVLVCHSMGGLVARAWLRTTPADRVAHVFTIGTPHGGTWIARFSHAANGIQMRLGSPWIRGLPQPPDPARFTCWHSDCDNMVFPPSTATLRGADNRLLRGPAHVDLAFAPELVESTLARVQGL
jgi:triacylglycerol lipase